jgi:hypothetical protein
MANHLMVQATNQNATNQITSNEPFLESFVTCANRTLAL